MILPKARFFHVFSAIGGLLLYSGVAAAIAWRNVPAGMEQGRWALLAAIAAPAWTAAGLTLAALLDGVAQFLFKRSAFGLGLGIVFFGTMLLNADKGGGHIAKLMGIALGAFFVVLVGACAVLLPLFFIRHRLNLRGQGANAQGRNQ